MVDRFALSGTLVLYGLEAFTAKNFNLFRVIHFYVFFYIYKHNMLDFFKPDVL